jgi:hypothetical protein
VPITSSLHPHSFDFYSKITPIFSQPCFFSLSDSTVAAWILDLRQAKASPLNFKSNSVRHLLKFNREANSRNGVAVTVQTEAVDIEATVLRSMHPNRHHLSQELPHKEVPANSNHHETCHSTTAVIERKTSTPHPKWKASARL